MPTDSERIAALERRIKAHLGPVPGESNIKSPHPGIVIAARDELPTASAELAYKTLILRGTDSTSDKIYTCLRDANQVWDWKLGHAALNTSIYIPATAMEPDGGVFANTNGSQGPRGVEEVNAVISGAFFSYELPKDADDAQNPNYTIIYWVSGTEVAKSIRFEHRYGIISVDDSALTNNVVLTTTTSRTFTAGRIYRDDLGAPSGESINAGEQVWGNILRLGSDGADSYGANIVVLGMIIDYTIA